METNVKRIFFDTKNGFPDIPCFELENGEVKNPYIRYNLLCWLTKEQYDFYKKIEELEKRPGWFRFWK